METILGFLTFQRAEPRCEGPTSYTSTTAALAAHLHLFASSPAAIKDNVNTVERFMENLHAQICETELFARSDQ